MSGLNLHLLGQWPPPSSLVRSWLSSLLALAWRDLNGSASEWAAYPMNLLMMAIMPVTAGRLFLRAVERWLPRHFFRLHLRSMPLSGAAVVVTRAGLCRPRLYAAGAFGGQAINPAVLPAAGLPKLAVGYVPALMVVCCRNGVASFDNTRLS